MPTTIGTGTEQSAITLNWLMADPTRIPMQLRSFFRQQFVADQVLRRAGVAKGGAVAYWVSNPVLPDPTGGGVEVIAPLAEIPVANPIVGAPASELVHKRGLGLRIGREQIDREDVGSVLLGMQQIRNAIVTAVDGAFMAKLIAAITQTVAVTTPWDAASGTTIRKDWAAANRIVENLRTSGLAYRLDTLLVNLNTRDALMFAPEFQAQFIGNVADQNNLLTGAAPTKVWNFNIIASPTIPTDKAIGLQSQVIGGIADERGTPAEPIEVSDPYPEPAYEATRWNVTRAAAGFVDAPGAAVLFTNVET
jgi:hypothetical protein